jgi:methionyl-tRNA formyltransferase
MRLIFAGTPAFAAQALDAIVAAGHDVALVLTRPDQPAGRGQRLRASAVKERAIAHGLAVGQPRTLRDPAQWPALAKVGADAMVVAAYGLILPAEVLRIPRFGCLNIHASLLPRWRGAAPIQRAIEAGDAETGVTIMQMDEGLDTGPMLLARALPIAPDETGGRLHDRLATLGADLMVAALAALAGGRLVPEPQPADGASYAKRIDKAESRIDWREPAATIARRMRAFDPAPGLHSTIDALPGGPVKFWAADPIEAPRAAAPGEIVESGARLVVACGSGALAVRELQKAGGRRLPVAQFLKGSPLTEGRCFHGRPD